MLHSRIKSGSTKPISFHVSNLLVPDKTYGWPMTSFVNPEAVPATNPFALSALVVPDGVFGRSDTFWLLEAMLLAGSLLPLVLHRLGGDNQGC